MKQNKIDTKIKRPYNKSMTIEPSASAVFDNGRRGEPRPGCDCEVCFGYCLIDKDREIHG